MAGNVWEWTRDGYSDTYYASSPGNDPANATGTSLRVMRGNIFAALASGMRASLRLGHTPTDALQVIGLRCVRSYP